MNRSYDYFVGLDVSQRTTSVCVIDADGKKFCEGKCNSRPEDIRGWLVNRVAEDALGEALALAEQMARHPAGALADLKRLNLAAWQTGLDAGLDAERDSVCALFLTGDGMQRIRDFVARSERKKAEGAKA